MVTHFEAKLEHNQHIVLTKTDDSKQVIYGGLTYDLEIRFTKYSDLGIYTAWVCVNNSYIEYVSAIKYFEIKQTGDE